MDALPLAFWDTSLRRRVLHFGHRYDYGRRRLGPRGGGDALAFPPWLEAIARRLVAMELFREGCPNAALLNEYDPGQGITRHVDGPMFGDTIAGISLLSPAEMRLSHPDGTLWALDLPSRSLLVLTGEARRVWRHAIPARKSDPLPDGGRRPRGRRLSLTLRTVRQPGG